ncbi:MAG: hypothetical protein ACRD15_00710, partial [Vicinamibacterales bacterium]
LYPWPESTRWAILTFEALLGKAGMPNLRNAPDPSSSSAKCPGDPNPSGTNDARVPHVSRPYALLVDQWHRSVDTLDRAQAVALRRQYQRL